LYEYTVISVDPATGKAFPDPNNPNGLPLADIDLSYVDEVYLPVASNVDDGGATAFMGTILPYVDFNKRTEAFLNLTTENKPIWSEFADLRQQIGLSTSSTTWDPRKPHNKFGNFQSRGSGFVFAHP
jgi:hypothetical protein